jgi:CheY-like chemotaxis protein
MGECLWVESTVGCGSTFHCTVHFDRHPEPVSPPPPAAACRRRDLPVLVVDDNATNRRILTEMLKRWGMRPTAVESGQAALAAVSQTIATSHPFSLGLLDGSMPDTDGYTLTARLKELPALATMPLLMLTSACQPWDMQHCQEVGITASLSKPVSQSGCCGTLSPWLWTRRQSHPWRQCWRSQIASRHHHSGTSCSPRITSSIRSWRCASWRSTATPWSWPVTARRRSPP